MATEITEAMERAGAEEVCRLFHDHGNDDIAIARAVFAAMDEAADQTPAPQNNVVGMDAEVQE